MQGVPCIARLALNHGRHLNAGGCKMPLQRRGKGGIIRLIARGNEHSCRFPKLLLNVCCDLFRSRIAGW